RGSQTRMHVVAVVTTLASEDHVAVLQRADVIGVLERAADRSLDLRRSAAWIRRAEEHGLEQLKVVFFGHALHEDRSNHATPAANSHSHFDSQSAWFSVAPRACAPGDKFLS